jgi:AcrR family transcriptional regulator
MIMNTRRRNLSADERRAATVDAVIELAAEQNPSEITTTAIAKHMGVTQGALFKHFPTKDAILQTAMEFVANRLLSRVDKAARAAPTPVAAIEAIFMTHIEFVVENPGVPRMLFGELQHARLTAPKRMAQTLLRRYGERLQGLIEEGKAAGELSASLDTGAGAILFFGTIQGLVMQSMLAGDVELIREDAPRVFAIFLRGIRSQQ